MTTFLNKVVMEGPTKTFPTKPKSNLKQVIMTKKTKGVQKRSHEQLHAYLVENFIDTKKTIDRDVFLFKLEGITTEEQALEKLKDGFKHLKRQNAQTLFFLYTVNSFLIYLLQQIIQVFNTSYILQHFKKTDNPPSYPVEDCDNNTTIPYDDQPFLQSSPIHQSNSNHFHSSWTGYPTAPNHITPSRPSIIRSPTIPSSFNTRPPPPTTQLQTSTHFSSLYPSLQTSTPSAVSSATSTSHLPFQHHYQQLQTLDQDQQ
ncbi:unnamed protein product [Mytilus edulis]|uniref:Uncharacterized protein n=1 Tax=Mytilus edulis TaxID=6550 RepID=A0A8S3RE62_MYTED|nr:unnamed protein product [Mytilus edulis]